MLSGHRSSLKPILVGIVIAMLSCPPAGADEYNGPDLTKWRGFSWSRSGRDANMALDKFADCVVKAKPAEARALAAIDEESAQLNITGSALAKDQNACLGVVALKFRPRLFRKTVIAALYRQDIFKNGLSTPISPLGKDSGQIGAANCVAHRNLTGVDRVLQSPIGSAGEKSAFVAMARDLSACTITPQRLQAHQLFRYDLAEAAYRLRQGQSKDMTSKPVEVAQ